MDFQQIQLPVDTLIQRIRSGRLGLPDFQRDFVWSPTQIAELLDTVARLWPMGSLLLLEGRNLFAAREIDSAPQLSQDGPDLYLLDGQQRVTSLFHAITNTSKYAYFVNFKALASGSADDIVNWARRPVFERSFPTALDRARSGIALISDIWDASEFFTWLTHIKSTTERAQFMRIREESLRGFQSGVYQVMGLKLEEGIGLDALARIFETINRTGVDLNAFDLLVAKLYPSNFMLREKWEEVLRTTPIIRHYAPNDLEIIKLVSLLIRRDLGTRASKGVRQGDILALQVKDIIEKWDEAVKLYTRALQRCMAFGSVCKDLVPSWSMVLGLAGGEIWLTDREVFHWWKESIAKQSFAQAANTKIVAEFDAKMAARSPGQEEPLTASEVLKRTVRANGLLSKGFASLMIHNGAVDPKTGELLSHCPSVKMKTLREDGSLVNIRAQDTLRNLIVISEETDNSIGGERFSDLTYWKESLLSQGVDSVLGVRSESHVKKILEGVLA